MSVLKNKLAEKLKIGTSGYSYQDWVGPFYPEGIEKSAMLDFYSQFFPVAEINASYYKIPGQHVFQRMADKTPESFEFIVKTHQETTHGRKENEASLSQLLAAVSPLLDCGKLKGFLAQFPYSFYNTERNRRYLAETKRVLKNHTLYVEFRNDSWLTQYLYPFLNEHNIRYVNVDEPALKGLLPPQEIVTSEGGYIRFHGRNREKWWDGIGSDRYDYEYTEDELLEWLTNISRVLKKSFKTYVFFNNHPNGQAIKNAQQMIEILNEKLTALEITG